MDLFYKGEELGCKEVNHSSWCQKKAGRCWARLCPSWSWPHVLCIKSAIFTYASSRHFSNTVKFNLLLHTAMFWKTAAMDGSKDMWKVHTLGKFGKSNFYLYILASARKLPLQSYFGLLAQICQLLRDISVSWEEAAFLGKNSADTDQWASYHGGSSGQATSEHGQGSSLSSAF